jgi:hypothetical protein
MAPGGYLYLSNPDSVLVVIGADSFWFSANHFNVDGNKIINLAAPTVNGDAINKLYGDNTYCPIDPDSADVMTVGVTEAIFDRVIGMLSVNIEAGITVTGQETRLRTAVSYLLIGRRTPQLPDRYLNGVGVPGPPRMMPLMRCGRPARTEILFTT